MVVAAGWREASTEVSMEMSHEEVEFKRKQQMWDRGTEKSNQRCPRYLRLQFLYSKNEDLVVNLDDLGGTNLFMKGLRCMFSDFMTTFKLLHMDKNRLPFEFKNIAVIKNQELWGRDQMIDIYKRERRKNGHRYKSSRMKKVCYKMNHTGESIIGH